MLNINQEIDKSIDDMQNKKDIIDRRVQELEWELSVYKNLSQIYQDNLKEWYRFKIERGWNR